MDCIVDSGIVHQRGNIGIVTRNEHILQLHEHGGVYSLQKGNAQKQGMNGGGEGNRSVYISSSYQIQTLDYLIIHKPAGRVGIHFVNL